MSQEQLQTNSTELQEETSRTEEEEIEEEETLELQQMKETDFIDEKKYNQHSDGCLGFHWCDLVQYSRPQ